MYPPEIVPRPLQMDTVIQKIAKENEACQRLTKILGVGPVTATALIAVVGNASTFRKGRDLSAWIGMVPRECSTGLPDVLAGIPPKSPGKEGTSSVGY
jgi:transposase